MYLEDSGLSRINCGISNPGHFLMPAVSTSILLLSLHTSHSLTSVQHVPLQIPYLNVTLDLACSALTELLLLV